MKANFIILLLYLLITACQSKSIEIKQPKLAPAHRAQTAFEQEKMKENNGHKLKAPSLSFNYNPKTKIYYSDTLEFLGIEYLVFGNLLNPDFSKSTLTANIDSIKIIKPKSSTLKTYGMGGYLYKSNNYSFEALIKFNDINGDKDLDLIVFNWMRSGSSGPSIYDVYQNINGKFSFLEHSTDDDIFISMK